MAPDDPEEKIALAPAGVMSGPPVRRMRTRTAAAVVAATIVVGSAALWLWRGRERSVESVVQPTVTTGTPVAGAGNDCFRPSFLPAGFAPTLAPGPAMAGGPLVGSTVTNRQPDNPGDVVAHWGNAPDFIDVVSTARQQAPPSGNVAGYPTLGGAEVVQAMVSGGDGQRTDFVEFLACGRWWYLSGQGLGGLQIRRVVDGLHYTHTDGATGVAGSVSFVGQSVEDGVRPGTGTVIIARTGDSERARTTVDEAGRFLLALAPGEYDIIARCQRIDCGIRRLRVAANEVQDITFRWAVR